MTLRARFKRAVPRAFRRAGFSTDLFDATDLAHCRMYHGWRDAWQGFGKNACEGMATPLALPLWTVLLGSGHVLPWLLLVWAALWRPTVSGLAMPSLAILTAVGFRLILAWRFRQQLLGVILHPISISLFLAMQWSALIRECRGRRVAWRGRDQPCSSESARAFGSDDDFL